jgi:hypothetical protein
LRVKIFLKKKTFSPKKVRGLQKKAAKRLKGILCEEGRLKIPLFHKNESY